MGYDNIVVGISAAFWSVTFALIGFSVVVAAIGNAGLVRILLAVLAPYAVVGIFYGSWAAQMAVSRSKVLHP